MFTGPSWEISESFLDLWMLDDALMHGNWDETIKMIPQVSPCMWKCKFLQTLEHPKWVHSWLKFLPSQDYQLFSQHDGAQAHSLPFKPAIFRFFREAWWPAHTAAGFLCAGGRCFTFDSSAQGHVRQRRGGSALKKAAGRDDGKRSLNTFCWGIYIYISFHQRCLSNTENVFPFLYTVRVCLYLLYSLVPCAGRDHPVFRSRFCFRWVCSSIT